MITPVPIMRAVLAGPAVPKTSASRLISSPTMIEDGISSTSVSTDRVTRAGQLLPTMDFTSP